MTGRPIRFEGRARRLFASAPENSGAEAISRRAALAPARTPPAHVRAPDLGYLGAPTVNVLELNAALAAL